MYNLQTIINSFNEIAIRLASNVELQKYLLIDNKDINAENFQPLTIQQLLDQQYICNGSQNEDAIAKMGRNTFLVISLRDITFADKNINVYGNIYIVNNINNHFVNNHEDRCLHIANAIIKSIDGLKLSSSIQIGVTSLSRVTYTQFLSGYMLNFNFSDQAEKEAEL